MLWLCLHFPRLSLEIFSRAKAHAMPWVVSHGNGTRRQVLLCNELAAARGIRAGMSLSAAYGLTPSLHVRARDAAAEQQALNAIAAWAGQYTSLVSLAPPYSLLLEIEGSLALFKGLDALLRRLLGQLAQLGYRSDVGIAPTPLAAELLARAGMTEPVMHLSELQAALRDVPLGLLALDAKQTRALHGLGLRRLGELLRLPRADLARRLGAPLIDYLDRLLGRRSDPREPYVPPPRFKRRLHLPAETADVEALLFPAQRLLLELSGFLRARDAGTQRLHWILAHYRRPPTQMTLGLATPHRDAPHLLTLLREHLARITLDHPVEAIELQVNELHPLQPRALTLDGEDATDAEDWPRLVERLRARLGDEAVQGLQCHHDHRPEAAWRACAPGEASIATPPPTRPLWLLPQPIALETHDRRPHLDGPLQLVNGPERIESGWWDGGDVARDYFIASDGAHARYWIFRERRGERQWYLHGYFA